MTAVLGRGSIMTERGAPLETPARGQARQGSPVGTTSAVDTYIMASNKSKRHTHKYRQILIAGTKVWACALPDCNHYMPQHMTALVEGKNSYCWNCGELFMLDTEAMKMDMPFCLNCRHPELSDVSDDLVKALGIIK